MKKAMNIVAIIPARGGSKRIPKKNIRSFMGKPIISYSIAAAQRTGLFDKIIVSTESDEIANVSKSYGAEVPFVRPVELADDFTGTTSVLLHALNWLADHGINTDYFCCIYATAPFIKAAHLKRCFELLKKEDATTAFPVTTFPYPIFRALRIGHDNRIEMFWPKHDKSRSNDLPEAYHDAGQFYWGNTKRFLKEKEIFSSNSVPLILPRFLVQDIDTFEDWEAAERIFLAFK